MALKLSQRVSMEMVLSMEDSRIPMVAHLNNKLSSV